MANDQYSEETNAVVKGITNGVGELMHYALQQACMEAIKTIYERHGLTTAVTYDKISYQITFDTEDLIALDKRLSGITDKRIGFDRKFFENQIKDYKNP